MTKNVSVIKEFFRDGTGRIVLFQRPNALLYGWVVCRSLSMILVEGRLRSGLGHLAAAFLFAWAYMETTKGVNYFRRLLGLFVLVVLVYGFFAQ